MNKKVYRFRKWLDEEIDGCKNAMIDYTDIGNYDQAKIYGDYLDGLIKVRKEFDKIFMEE